ncbi:unnamed protein product [Periconia digitata]|uniref:Heterokaryon incompatibility domain-containing protein n=1 Tax=Periconia digitata TaxID=1303443 RepID=A0A9W4XKP7_9PLEO|nr:unnamed protein product [Periconia digitata]
MDIQHLCRYCSYNRTRLEHWVEVPVIKGIPLNNLLESSLRCARCMIFNETLRQNEVLLYGIGGNGRISLDIHLLPKEQATQTYDPDSLIFSSIVEKDPITTDLFQWEFDPFLKDLDLGQYFRFEHPVRPPDRSMEYLHLGMLRRCYETCLMEHSACRQDTTPMFVPTRLIDAFDMTLSHTSWFSENSRADRRYAALSHQWGQEDFFKLTRITMAEITRDGQTVIPLNHLRRTFQDAIKCTEMLGLKYLWIDSLCIIQGPKDESEWHREAALMAQIYRNAAVTIAASDAARLKDGFLWTKLSEPNASISLGSRYNGSVGTELLVTRDCEKPLDRRGWVVQEHLLALRTIHFSDPIVWECRELTAKRVSGRLSVFPSISTPKIWTSKARQGDGYELWKQIIERYSNCLLSVSSDKLVAISGVARVLATALNWEYIAGHWTQTILPSLLWETATLDSSRAEDYRAPSWSWASIDGRIKFLAISEGFSPLAEVINAEVTSPHSDPFGELSRASLRMKCRLIPLGVITPQELVYNDKNLRVSLDGFYTAHMYLLPLIKISNGEQYLSLLLKKNIAANSMKEREYQRLGDMVTYLHGRQEINPGIQAPPMNWTWWSNAFYCREKPEGAVRAFNAEDFEVGSIHEIDLI